jgi:MFS family permease
VHRYPAFRLLLLGTLVADTSFWMYQVALGWLAFQMTSSAFFVGMVGFAGGIPLLLVCVPAGVIIDRFDRRSVLLLGQVGLILVMASFSVLVGTGTIGQLSMLALAAAFGTIISFVLPTRTAMIPSFVQRDDLANAVALGAATHNMTRVFGPVFAGLLIGLLGAAETFGLAGGLQALALLTTVRLPSLRSESPTRIEGLVSSLSVGFRVAAERPYLAALIVLALAPTVLLMPYINLMPVFAREELHLGSVGLGVLLASTGLGTVAGSLAVARGSRNEVSSWSQVLTAAVFAACVMAFTQTSVVAVAVLFLFAAGWTSASFFAMNQAALQLNVEDDVRGRVISVHMLTWGILPFGQLLVATIANSLGTPLAMMSSCVMALVGIGMIAWRFPLLRAGSDAVSLDVSVPEVVHQAGGWEC